MLIPSYYYIRLFFKFMSIHNKFLYKLVEGFLFPNRKEKNNVCVAIPAVEVDVEVLIVPVAQYLLNQFPPEGVVVDYFPYRVGRIPLPNEKASVVPNQLNILDIKPFQLSRSHFVIDCEQDKNLVLLDVSRFGTIVNGVKIGGLLKQKKAYLMRGKNEVIVGETNSCLVFNVMVS